MVLLGHEHSASPRLSCERQSIPPCHFRPDVVVLASLPSGQKSFGEFSVFVKAKQKSSGRFGLTASLWPSNHIVCLAVEF